MSYLRLIYRSRQAQVGDRRQDLSRILQVSRGLNPRHGSTGALTLCGDTYIQVLEGRSDVVEGMMRSIERDPRHYDVRVMGRWTASGRLFSGWSMAHASVLGAPVPVLDRLQRGEHGLDLVGTLFTLANEAPAAL